MVRDTSGEPWILLASLWTVGVCVTAFQIVPAGILPIVMDDLGIGPVAASWLVSTSLAAQAVGNIPVGVIIDRTSNRLILTAAAAGMVVAGLGAWQAGLNGDYWLLTGAIAVGGVAIAGVITGGANLIGGAFEGEREATAVAAFTTAAPAGYAIGQFLGPVLADRFGWAANFLLFGGLAGVAFVGTIVVLSWVDVDPEVGSQPTIANFKRLFRNVNLWIVCVLGFLAYSLYLFFNSWMPTYINQEFGFSLAQSGLYAALFPAIGVLARAGGGAISDQLFDRQRRPVALVTFGVTIPLVALIALIEVPLLLALLLIPAGFFVQLGIGLFYTYVREVVSTEVTGTALAMLGLISFMGAFTAPVVAGSLIELSGDYLLAFGYAGCLAVLGVALSYVAPEPHNN
jgi:nitrate/nitrite transporter NarK